MKDVSRLGTGIVVLIAMLSFVFIFQVVTQNHQPAPIQAPSLLLRYGDSSSYDPDNDGIVTSDGIVDFMAEPQFHGADGCVEWLVSSYDLGLDDALCSGSAACCGSIGVKSDMPLGEPLLLYRGRLSAGQENMVSARAHVITASGPIAGDWQRLPAVFSDGPRQELAEVGKPVSWSGSIYAPLIGQKKAQLPTQALSFEEIRSLGNALAFDVRYTTPPPVKVEDSPIVTPLAWQKHLIISSPFHYKDVRSQTDIPETPKDRVHLYWYVDGEKKDITTDPALSVELVDTNGNGLVDRITWITPHLSTQQFEVVISLQSDPEIMEGVQITLLTPTEGEFVRTDGPLSLNFTVTYNASVPQVLCNISVDGTVLRSNMDATGAMEVILNKLFSSALHSWLVDCWDDRGVQTEAGPATFYTDLDPPTITLNTPADRVFDQDVQLNFTPADALDPSINCNVTIDDTNAQLGDLPSGRRYTFNQSLIADGRHRWNVSCVDHSGHGKLSESRYFYVAEQGDASFSVSPNKDIYTLGEAGYLLVSSPFVANLTLFIVKPDGSSTIRSFVNPAYPLIDPIDYDSLLGGYEVDAIFRYGADATIRHASFSVTLQNNGTDGSAYFSIIPNKGSYLLGEGGYMTIDSAIPANLTLFVSSDMGDSFFQTWTMPAYPFIYPINFTVREGDYTVEGIFGHGGALDVIRTSLSVSNSLNVNIDTNYSLIEKGQNGYFEAEASGGIDAITYEWRFGDGTTATGSSVAHAYDTRGDYTLSVKATDSKGNFAEDSRDIVVKQKMTLTVQLLDDVSGARISGCSVRVAGKNLTTTNDGVALFVLFDDDYGVAMSCPGYRPIRGTISLIQDQTFTYRMVHDALYQPPVAPPMDTTPTPSTNLSQTHDDIAEIDELVRRVDGYSGDIGIVASTMGISAKLTEAKRLLENAYRDLDSVPSAKGDRVALEKDLRDRIAEIKSTTPKSLTLLNQEEYISYPDSDITASFAKYIAATKLALSKPSLDRYRASVALAQKGLSVKVRPMLVQVAYLDGTLKTQTVVPVHATYEAAGAQTALVIDVPKSIAPSAADVSFDQQPTILAPDPLFQLPLVNDTSFVMTIENRIELGSFRDIKFLAIIPNPKMKSGLTASVIGLQDPEKLKVVAEVAGIIILVVVYLFIQFDLGRKLARFDLLKPFRRMMPGKDVHEVRALVRKGEAQLREGQIDEARATHTDCMRLYNAMPSSGRERVGALVEEFYARIILENVRVLIAETRKLLFSDKKMAKANYREISSLYEQLPKHLKGAVMADCAALYKEISS